MKPLYVLFYLMCLCACIGAPNAYFQNGDFGDGIDRRVYDLDGLPVYRKDYTVQLFAVEEFGINAVEGAKTQFSRSIERSPGVWIGRSITLPIGPGESMRLVIGVWDSHAASSLFDAQAAGTRWGMSAPFEYTVPTVEFPGPNDFKFTGLRSFGLVPEPSAIGLTIAGGLLLLGIAKKQPR
jgi:hypothetical protein